MCLQCMCTCAGLPACAWRPEDVRHPSLSLSTLILWEGISGWTWSYPGGPKVSPILLSPPSTVLVLRVVQETPVQGFSSGVLGTWTQVLTLVQQVLYLLSHVPSPNLYCPELTMEPRMTLDFCSSFFYLWMLGWQVWATLLGLCGTENGTRGFGYTRQALCWLNCIPRL